MRVRYTRERKKYWAVVMAQLVERLLPTPEVCGLNPAIGKLLCGPFVYYQRF